MRLWVFQVSPGRESAALVVTRQHCATNLIVVLHRCQILGDPICEVLAPSVPSLGTAEGDNAHLIALFVQCRHCDSPFCRATGCRQIFGRLPWLAMTAVTIRDRSCWLPDVAAA